MLQAVLQDFFRENSKEASVPLSSIESLLSKSLLDGFVLDWLHKMYMKLIKIYSKYLSIFLKIS